MLMALQGQKQHPGHQECAALDTRWQHKHLGRISARWSEFLATTAKGHGSNLSLAECDHVTQADLSSKLRLRSVNCSRRVLSMMRLGALFWKK